MEDDDIYSITAALSIVCNYKTASVGGIIVTESEGGITCHRHRGSHVISR